MPITIAPIEVNLVIIKIMITDAKTKKHLEDIGIAVNSSIRILSRNSGNCIIVYKGGRLALDYNLSKSIFVMIDKEDSEEK